MSERDDTIDKAAQEIAKGTCHHTTLGEMRTLTAIIGKVWDAAVRRTMPCHGCGRVECQWCQREIDGAMKPAAPPHDPEEP